MQRVCIFVCALALFSTTIPGTLFAQKIQGTPFRGQSGITESVATIMAREQKEAPKRTKSLQSKKRGRLPDDNSDAPAVSGPTPPASGGGNEKTGPEQNPSIVEAIATDQPFTSALSQTVNTSFLAATYADSNFVPPNAQGA